MKEDIKFSICIPNYNYAKYIGLTIRSVLDQTYSNFEVIVSDNSSEDNSIEIVKSFRDDRIKIYVNEYNIGFSPNLDKATQSAVGDYIILLSSDDLMRPGALEEYAKTIHSHRGNQNDLIIMSACDIIDSDGMVVGEKQAMTGDVIGFLKKRKKKVSNEENQFNGLYLLESLLVNRFQPAGQFLTTCVSRSLFIKVEGYNSILSIWPDAHFSHKILSEDPLVVYLHKKLFAYRIHNGNNLAATEQVTDIKALTDGYHLTLLYPDSLLERAGVNRSQLKRAFVKNICLLPSLFALLRGNFKKTFQYLLFSFASYPNIAIKNWRAYIIFLFLPFCPFLRVLNFIRKFHK